MRAEGGHPKIEGVTGSVSDNPVSQALSGPSGGLLRVCLSSGRSEAVGVLSGIIRVARAQDGVLPQARSLK